MAKTQKIVEALWYMPPPTSLFLKIMISPIVVLGVAALYVKESFFPRQPRWFERPVRPKSSTTRV